jgi:translation elongation factor EF-4
MILYTEKIIIGNKIDMEDSIKVTAAEIKQYADSIKVDFVLTSALTDSGIDEAFDKIIDRIEDCKVAGPSGNALHGPGGGSKKKKKEGCAC